MGAQALSQSTRVEPVHTGSTPNSYWRQVWRRLRRDNAAIAGMVLVGLIVLLAAAAPWVAPHDPAEQFRDGLTLDGQPIPSTLAAGSFQFILGTDAVGRDLLSRLLYGARVSLMVGVLANLLALAIGTVVGAAAGFLRGWTENILMRITDIMMAFPTLLLAMALVAILKPSVGIIIGVIGLVYWTWIARVIYGQVLVLREREFVTAATALGTPRSPDLVPAHRAASRPHHHRLGLAGDCDQRDAGGEHELSWHRRAAAHSFLGQHDPAGTGVLPDGAVAGGGAGVGNHGDGVCVQPAGGRTA